jgi:hypothetical protein
MPLPEAHTLRRMTCNLECVAPRVLKLTNHQVESAGLAEVATPTEFASADDQRSREFFSSTATWASFDASKVLCSDSKAGRFVGVSRRHWNAKSVHQTRKV